MEHVTPAPFSFTELTPTAFLDRAEHAFAARPAVVDGEQRFTYAEFGERSPAAGRCAARAGRRARATGWRCCPPTAT